jgi:hypothetical protein
MDFLIGLLLTIVLILILLNFTSISMSDSDSSNQQCANNSLFTALGLGSGIGLTNIGGIGGTYQIPQPILASAPSALNNKVNLEQQSYDYHKYFFVN